MNYLLSNEKTEIAKLQAEIDGIYSKARNLESILATAQGQSNEITATLQEKLWQAANSENPLEAYREVARSVSCAEELAEFAETLQPMVERIIATAKPVQQRQAAIDRAASERQREINRLEESRLQHGLKAAQEKELERLLAVQNG